MSEQSKVLQSIAHEIAIKEISDRLKSSGGLDKVRQLRAEYEKKHTSFQTQLRAVLQTQVDETRRAVQLLEKSCYYMSHIKQCLGQTQGLCRKCREDLPDYDSIKQLRTARTNLVAVIQKLKEFESIPDKIQGLRILLENDPSKLLEVYCQVYRLDKLQQAASAQATIALEEHTGSSSSDQFRILKGILDEMSIPAQELKLVILNEKVMGIIGDYFDKAQYDPPTLIRALEIIERTKMAYQNEAKQKTGSIVDHEQRAQILHEQVIQTINTAIDKRVEEYMLRVKSAIARETGTTDQSVTESNAVIRLGRQLVVEMYTIVECIVPCFPPDYEMQSLHLKKYKQIISINVDKVCRSYSPDPGTQLKLVQMVQDFKTEIQKIGIDDDCEDMLTVIDGIMETYQNSQLAKLREWFNNIIKRPFSYERTSTGAVRNSTPEDMFTFLFHNFEVASEIIRGKHLAELGKSCGDLLLTFQEEEKNTAEAIISGKLIPEIEEDELDPLVLYSVIGNNSMRGSTLCSSLAERVGEILGEEENELLGEALDDAAEGFISNAVWASTKILDCIFDTLTEYTSKLFKEPWIHEEPIWETVMLTLNDYMGDIEVLLSLDQFFLTKFITQLYEHVVCLYVENFFTTNDHFSGPTASAIIKKDHKQILDFFLEYKSRFRNEDFVVQKATVISDLANFLDTENFDLYIETLSSHFSSQTAQVVDHILKRRNDVERSVRVEFVESLRNDPGYPTEMQTRFKLPFDGRKAGNTISSVIHTNDVRNRNQNSLGGLIPGSNRVGILQGFNQMFRGHRGSKEIEKKVSDKKDSGKKPRDAAEESAEVKVASLHDFLGK